MQFIHGDELVEHAIVEHKQHAGITGVVLYAEETLACVVGFHIVHVRLGDDLLVLLTVRGKRNSSVEEHFQVRPQLLNIFLAAYLKHPDQHGEHPRGHATDVGHVFVHGFACYMVALHLKVAQQSRFLTRHSEEIGHRIHVLYEHGAQVAHDRIGQIIVGRVAPTQY